MRLIDATLRKLRDFDDESQLPPYAVLSHTWTGYEVTAERLKEAHSTDRGKRDAVRTTLGYRKIAKACQQAALDGLDWAWVDTCCINKSSSAELSEAINSMYRYYRKAAVCYAYLDDVEAEDSPVLPEAQASEDPASAIYIAEKDLRNARWFTRGWTLQELIAPKDVVFYAKGWKLLGRRQFMRPMLRQITGISDAALRCGNLNNESVARRMSWMAKRSTTRVEDMAYSLLGIFDVNMPLLYGEGDKAFIRLQEEIMKNSDDQSLFAWTPPFTADGPHSPRTAFATHPSDFATAGNIEYSPFFFGQGQPFALTNKGIQLRLCLLPAKTGAEERYMALLECHYSEESSRKHRPAIIIQRLTKSATQYCRLANTSLVPVHVNEWSRAEWKDVYLCKTIPRPWWQY
ncbi:hypothetical protein ACN47E_008570 [Coniothyrium glycines]